MNKLSTIIILYLTELQMEKTVQEIIRGNRICHPWKTVIRSKGSVHGSGVL